MADMFVILLLLIAAGLAVRGIFHRKKNGSSCCGTCSGCSGCSGGARTDHKNR